MELTYDVVQIDRIKKLVYPKTTLKLVEPPFYAKTLPEIILDPPLDRNERKKVNFYWQYSQHDFVPIRSFIAFISALNTTITKTLYILFERRIKSQFDEIKTEELDIHLLKKLEEFEANDPTDMKNFIYNVRTKFYSTDEIIPRMAMKALQKGATIKKREIFPPTDVFVHLKVKAKKPPPKKKK